MERKLSPPAYQPLHQNVNQLSTTVKPLSRSYFIASTKPPLPKTRTNRKTRLLPADLGETPKSRSIRTTAAPPRQTPDNNNSSSFWSRFIGKVHKLGLPQSPTPTMQNAFSFSDPAASLLHRFSQPVRHPQKYQELDPGQLHSVCVSIIQLLLDRKTDAEL